MSKSFLGRGIGFPLRVDGTGGIDMSSYEENIEECIRIILGTAPGERLYRPEFGCHAHDYVFAPNNAHTRNLVAYYTREALLKWEPRIDEIEVSCHADASAPNTLRLEIGYAVRATNSHFNLVYPFFLRREEDL
ncbi:MAG: GPW/gp25 family protein [Myxococcales bacterium]|nr:GPW/gp25 family protein [Myxococcales bacterium]MCB9549530.1 GPW/gp25 family protein [Myxococcales bacterium]